MLDGEGLYLLVKISGKYWCWNYRFGGKCKTLVMGTYPNVPLESRIDKDRKTGESRKIIGARERHNDALNLLNNGIDPTAKINMGAVVDSVKHKRTDAAVDLLPKEIPYADNLFPQNWMCGMEPSVENALRRAGITKFCDVFAYANDNTRTIHNIGPIGKRHIKKYCLNVITNLRITQESKP